MLVLSPIIRQLIIGLRDCLLGIVLLAQLSPASATPTMNFSYTSGCTDDVDPACLKCGIRGCMKCPHLILVDSRKCIEDCPVGYTELWSSAPDFMGRICYPVGISGSILTAVVGVITGAVLCFCLLSIVAALVRRKYRLRQRSDEFLDDSISRHEYLRQLNELRPQSEYFLQMLNDSRRQVRKLHLSGDVNGAEAYTPVIRDLAKILILLNKPVELLNDPPHDWCRLYAWAERALDCYKPQIEQLIEFLQSPASTDPRLASSQHLTFKSLTMSTNNSQTQQLLGSLISLHELDENLEDVDEDSGGSSSKRDNSTAFGDTFDHVKSYLSSSPGRNSTIWLEDEFYRLGNRPQDELTTEL